MIPIPYFDATNFTAITDDMRTFYDDNGFLVLENLVSHTDCDMLVTRMDEILAAFDPQEVSKTIFSATEDFQNRDQYFLESGNAIHYFYERGALNDNGDLITDPAKCLNKVGHAMHDLDPVFDRFSRQAAFKTICNGIGMQDPKLAQSMYIFKQPHIGDEVQCHQDGTYLWTEPQTVTGLWIALEDATLENGCLWGIPRAHKTDTPKQRFSRTPDGQSTQTIILDESPFDEDKRVPLEVKKGSLVVLHSHFPHLSGPNTSAKSRHAYTLHIVDGPAHYPADNWLQRPADHPFRGF